MSRLHAWRGALPLLAHGVAASQQSTQSWSGAAFSVPGEAVAARGARQSALAGTSVRAQSLGKRPLPDHGRADTGSEGQLLGKGFVGLLLLAPLLVFRHKNRKLSRLQHSRGVQTWNAAASGTSADSATAAAATPWKGVKAKPFAFCVALGLLIRFGLPIPTGVTPQAWSMLSIFVATISGIVTEPLPAPGVAMCGLTCGILTGTISFAEGMASFTDEVIWLVVLAFFFARGFSKTGLGDRIAFNVVRAVGGTTLGLAYGLNAAEAIVAAGMPSSAARAAGIFFPIVDSVAKASGSDPAQGTEKKTGRFLVQSAFQATGNSATLWLTGAAQNMLVLRLASQIGYDMPSPFKTWLVACSVPALVAMALTPLVAFKLFPPEVKRTPEAPEAARTRLSAMGPMSRDELVMAFTLLGMVALWAGATFFHISPVVTALLGLCTLMLFGTVTWADCVNEKGAWTTFTWFAILVGMSAMLNKLGIVKWLASTISSRIVSLGLTAGPAFIVLSLVYTAAHYLFASQVAQVGALYQPFAVMMIQTGTPPMVAVLALAAVSNFFCSLTPYASAQAPVFYGAGYVTQAEWYRGGAVFTVFNLLVWGVVGGAWWKALGML